MVRLQALSEAGSGNSAEIYFRTPVVQEQQAGRLGDLRYSCYVYVYHSQFFSKLSLQLS